MTNTAVLRQYLDQSGYKLRFIAEQLGISYQSFINKVNNVTSFKPSEIATLCELVGIDDLADKERIFFAPDVD